MPRDHQSPSSRAARIEAWFTSSARDLPWRHDRTGYTGLVSEAMLQQTQVARVVESYAAFMERFPTINALAAADEQDVLAAWKGLGYYRRARSLQAAARMVVEEFGGVVPRDVASLLKLPGVGRYTAGAISSIVYGERAPIVDGNVARVTARWFDDERVSTARDAVAATWERATELVDASTDPALCNEGLMELGALICTPRAAQCLVCPLRDGCLAHERGRVDQIPPPKRAAKQEVVHHHVVVVERSGKLLLEQRPERGLWSGMWQPPAIEADAALDADAVRDALGFAVTSLEAVSRFPYQTTHRKITFHVYVARTRKRSGRWEERAAIEEVPMSNAHRRVIEVACAG